MIYAFFFSRGASAMTSIAGFMSVSAVAYFSLFLAMLTVAVENTSA